MKMVSGLHVDDECEDTNDDWRRNTFVRHRSNSVYKPVSTHLYDGSVQDRHNQHNVSRLDNSKPNSRKNSNKNVEYDIDSALEKAENIMDTLDLPQRKPASEEDTEEEKSEN